MQAFNVNQVGDFIATVKAEDHCRKGEGSIGTDAAVEYQRHGFADIQLHVDSSSLSINIFIAVNRFHAFDA